MGTKLRSKISLLFVVVAVLVAIPAIAAFADSLEDNLQGAAQTRMSITQNDETGVTVNYWVADTGTAGCDISASNPATFSFALGNSDPSGGVTASPSTLTFTQCGSETSNFQTVKYTGSIPYGNTTGEGNGYSLSWNRTSGPTIQTAGANSSLQVTPDKQAPTVTGNTPTGTSEPVGTNVTATSSEKMDPNTISGSTFTLKKTSDNSSVSPTSVTYNATDKKATLDPTNDLDPSTQYTATVTTGVKDLAGNPLASNKTWSFTTAAPACTTPANPVFSGSPDGDND